MISIEPDPPQSTTEQTDRFFEPGGILETACLGSGTAFEPRPQQQRMARGVAEATSMKYHLAVEAGTGVGKSFAYLVPQILSTLAEDTRCVVATYTITLQEQLIGKDLPFIRRALQRDFKAVLVKGRSNYLCLRRLTRARKTGNTLLEPHRGEQLEAIYLAAQNQQLGDGSLQSFSQQPDLSLWGEICSEHGNCPGKRCPFHKNCYFQHARLEMQHAQVLVVNHSLFFSDLALRAEGAGMLPAYASVVFDEAHQMESVASSHLGLRLSPYMLDYWLGRIARKERKGICPALGDSIGSLLVMEAGEAAQRFFEQIRTHFKLSEKKNQQRAFTPPPIETNLPRRLTKLCTHLKMLSQRQEEQDTQLEIRSLQKKGLELRDTVETFLKQSLNNQVYWVELEGRRRQPVLHSAPVDVGPLLQEILFDSIPCVVMTSATLSVAGKLDYFRQRVGAYECEELQVGSPFDYARQMRIQIPIHIPPPSSERFEHATEAAIAHFVHESQGRVFVLFTNARFMRKVADALRDEFISSGYEFLVQGTGTPPRHMLERFRAHSAAVLFGLDRFWMGVDVRGDALSHVIITRLPFSVPDHPLTQARFEIIEERGGNPFREYSLPEAILKFRQGVGRLIRSANDRGVITILDSRIRNQWYGRLFLSSLEECPVEELQTPAFESGTKKL